MRSQRRGGYELLLKTQETKRDKKRDFTYNWYVEG